VSSEDATLAEHRIDPMRDKSIDDRFAARCGSHEMIQTFESNRCRSRRGSLLANGSVAAKQPLTACERATAVRRLTDRMFFATVDVAGGNFQGCIDA
jgi:hypothetical protein